MLFAAWLRTHSLHTRASSPRFHCPAVYALVGFGSWHSLRANSRSVAQSKTSPRHACNSSIQAHRPDTPSVCLCGDPGGQLLSRARRRTRAKPHIARRSLGRGVATTSTCLSLDRVSPARRDWHDCTVCPCFCAHSCARNLLTWYLTALVANTALARSICSALKLIGVPSSTRFLDARCCLHTGHSCVQIRAGARLACINAVHAAC